MRILRSVLLAALLAAHVAPAAARVQAEEALYAPLIDDLEASVADAIDADLPRYDIEAAFEPATGPASATLIGSVALDYVNATGADQSEIHLRLYPNNPQYADGGMALVGLTVGGDPVEGTLSLDDTLLTVGLASPLADGDHLALAVDFASTVPTDPTESYGMYKFDPGLETYALAHWFPMLAGIDPDGTWLTDPLSETGDPVFSNAALFDVTIDAPTEMVVVTSGGAVPGTGLADAETGRTVTRYASGPSRDFVMAASERFRVVERRVGGTTVRSYAVDGSEEGNQLVLTGAAQSLAVFNRLIGDYPFEELDLVQVPLGNGAGGVEFPGLLFIGADYYDDGPGDGIVPSFLEFVVAHEVGHQWWYAVVGNNQYRHAFIDEALTNYLTVVYFTEQYGADVGERQENFQLKLSYFQLLFEQGDGIVDQPTDDFPTDNAYGALVYGKGALGFGALRAEIGADSFFGALQTYYADFQFAIATPLDLLTAFETSSGQQLDEFWRHWFQAAEGEQDYDATDLADLLIEIGT